MATIAAENKVIADLWIGSIKAAIRASKDFLIAYIILTPLPPPFLSSPNIHLGRHEVWSPDTLVRYAYMVQTR